MLVSVCLEVVLSLTQDRCTVCAERTIGSEIVLDIMMVLLRDEAQVDACFVLFCLEIVLSLMQDMCTGCAERTIGSEIILVAPDGTPR